MGIVVIIAIVLAALWTAFVCYANGMKSSSSQFDGVPLIVVPWLLAFIPIFIWLWGH
jgi:hypothetical protein